MHLRQLAILACLCTCMLFVGPTAATGATPAHSLPSTSADVGTSEPGASLSDVIFAKVRVTGLESLIRQLQKERVPHEEITKATAARDALQLELELAHRLKVDNNLAQHVTRAQSAIARAEQAIRQKQRLRSSEEMKRLELSIADAVIEGATEHTPDRLKEIARTMRRIRVEYDAEEYITVQDAIEMLKPKVDQMKTITTIEATSISIREHEQKLAALKTRGANSQVTDELSRKLEETKLLFANNDYEGAHSKVRELSRELDQAVKGQL